jgi:hypothetical protein
MKIKTNTVLFWVFLVMPVLCSALLTMLSREAADPLIGWSIVIWIVSSLYCGIWLGIKSSRSDGIRVLLSFFFILAIGAINCCILAAGCSGKVDFR